MRMTGETIVLEGMIGRRTGLAIPATVVDPGRPNLLACFIPGGVATLRLVQETDRPLPRVLSPGAIEQPGFVLRSRIWSGQHVLYLAPVSGRYAIHLRWSEDWVFAGWYVNLQRPTVQEHDRWITEDRFLDIVVPPDRQWRWKDADELVEAVAIGRLSEEEATVIRAVGEAIIPEIEAGRWPFDPMLALWRPDPRWALPEIPADWEPTRR
jgi:hypothetical protein